jgi:hypothetical protein
VSDHDVGVDEDQQAANSRHWPTKMLAPLDWGAAANKPAKPSKTIDFLIICFPP